MEQFNNAKQMFDYLQKFNCLPKDLRDKVSGPEAIKRIDKLEKEFGVDLAAIVMKVMVKDVAINDLAIYLASESGLDEAVAQQLARRLKEEIFFAAAADLGLETKKKAEKIPRKPLPKVTVDADIVKFRPQKSSAGASSFFFSPEDEEEVRELSGKIIKLKEAVPTAHKIEERVNNIIASAQINFGSEDLIKRFKQIISTYLRGIRDRIETKQTLMKPLLEGGLGFDEESADKVLRTSTVGGKKTDAPVSIQPPVDVPGPLAGDRPAPQVNRQFKIKEPPRAKVNIAKDTVAGLKESGVRDLDYDLAALKEAGKQSRPVGKLDVKHELAPPPPSLRPQAPGSVSPAPAVKREKQAAEAMSGQAVDRVAVETKPRIQIRRPGEGGYKKRIEDVKYMPKIMGPIDELRYLDPVGFRRLAQQPDEITAKIKEKINLLEEEEYSKRIAGIQAWRRSPVNRLYLQIGRDSISQGKPISVIIEERKNAGKDYLSSAEFEAIMDLNKSLRF